ncbi:MAG: 2-C-methyl-D-erythritol 4-phosphate cytidylyltransferase, partial [Candidatus Marinimicrobia bacterium]|nr:2-C-methyl-D-erythritol 4-phosphate cytidylyltransferase [Candidatus Neomarinimicrobiota bacterium]
MEENEITPIAAIIPAAGQGTRLGGQTKKQFQLLAGKPLLVRTVERILQAPEIRWVVVAVPESDLELARDILSDAIPASV